ncbi:hypothetical protein [Bacillus toyonensis]|uniref:hypothetical protein n=1 Tax=Bacillus toyonensis TaxID=155322 RepID=UPI002E244331|nr:hypothetical protein [Bacillus toyonensis]
MLNYLLEELNTNYIGKGLQFKFVLEKKAVRMSKDLKFNTTETLISSAIYRMGMPDLLCTLDSGMINTIVENDAFNLDDERKVLLFNLLSKFRFNYTYKSKDNEKSMVGEMVSVYFPGALTKSETAILKETLMILKPEIYTKEYLLNIFGDYEELLIAEAVNRIGMDIILSRFSSLEFLTNSIEESVSNSISQLDRNVIYQKKPTA